MDWVFAILLNSGFQQALQSQGSGIPGSRGQPRGAIAEPEEDRHAQA